jgi:hypothetical protein
MWASIKNYVLAFHATFHSSLVILFARVQVLIGAVWVVLTATDLAPLIGNQKYLTLWLVFSGVVTELSRRQGTEVNEDNKLVPRRAPEQINVTVNNAPAPASPLGPTSGDTK